MSQVKAVKVVLSCALFVVTICNAWGDCPTRWKATGGDGRSIETANPGYFDVGAGYGYINASNAGKQAASGFFASVRAYPCGRWYAPAKKMSSTAVSDKLKTAVAANVESAAASAAADAAQGNASAQTTKATKAANADTTAKDYASILSEYQKNQIDLYPVTNNLLNRLSVYYGRSIGDFDKSIVKGPVDSIGLAFDIAPEFAITAGVAFYQINLSGGGIDTRHRFMLGVQMNLNAFSAFRNIGSSGN